MRSVLTMRDTTNERIIRNIPTVNLPAVGEQMTVERFDEPHEILQALVIAIDPKRLTYDIEVQP